MKVISCFENEIVLLPDTESEIEILEKIALYGTFDYRADSYFTNSPVRGFLLITTSKPKTESKTESKTLSVDDVRRIAVEEIKKILASIGSK